MHFHQHHQQGLQEKTCQQHCDCQNSCEERTCERTVLWHRRGTVTVSASCHPPPSSTCTAEAAQRPPPPAGVRRMLCVFAFLPGAFFSQGPILCADVAVPVRELLPQSRMKPVNAKSRIRTQVGNLVCVWVNTRGAAQGLVPGG